MKTEKDERESVKVRSVTMAVLREWADATDKSVSGLCTDILTSAAGHYMDGVKKGLQLAQEAIKGKP